MGRRSIKNFEVMDRGIIRQKVVFLGVCPRKKEDR